VQEVDTSEGASDNWVDVSTSALKSHLSVAANMRENVALAKFNEGQLAVVAVRKEI
jgi:hypothetical protein